MVALVQGTRSHTSMTCASCFLYDCSCSQREGICGAVWSMPGTPSRFVCAHERCGARHGERGVRLHPVKDEWLVYELIVNRLEDHSEDACVCNTHRHQLQDLFNDLNVVVGAGGNPEVKAPVRARFPPRAVHAVCWGVTRALCFDVVPCCSRVGRGAFC
jgi:hypothetical protein